MIPAKETVQIGLRTALLRWLPAALVAGGAVAVILAAAVFLLVRAAGG